MNTYYGQYQYTDAVVRGWNSDAIGIYYCGQLDPQNPNLLIPHYIGRAVGAGGIRGRLLEHMRDDYWPGVTHFGYQLCASVRDAELIEEAEIKRCQPRHNVQLR